MRSFFLASIFTAITICLVGLFASPSSAQQSDDPQSFEEYAEKYQELYAQEKFAEAALALERGIALYDANGVGDPVFRAEIATILINTFYTAGDVQGTLRAAEAALAYPQPLVNRFTEFYTNLAWAQSEMGFFNLAGFSYEQAATFAKIQQAYEPMRYTDALIAALNINQAYTRTRGSEVIPFRDGMKPMLDAITEYERLTGERSDPSRFLLGQAYLTQTQEVLARQTFLELAGTGSPDVAGPALSWLALIEWQLGDRLAASETARAALETGSLSDGRAAVMRGLRILARVETPQDVVLDDVFDELNAQFANGNRVRPNDLINAFEVLQMILDVIPDDALEQNNIDGLNGLLSTIDPMIATPMPGDYFLSRKMMTARMRLARLLEFGTETDRTRASDLYQQVWLWTGASMIDTAQAMAGLGRTGIVIEGELRADLDTRADFSESAARAAAGFLETIPSRFESFQAAQVARLSYVMEQSVDAQYDEMLTRNVISVDDTGATFQSAPYSFLWETTPEAPLAPLVLEGLSGIVLERVYSQIQQARLSAAGRAVEEMSARIGAGDDALAQLLRARDTLIKDRIRLLELGEENEATQFSELSRIDAELTALEADLDEAYPAFRNQVAIRPLTLTEARDLIGPEEALVTYLMTDRGMHVFAVTPERVIWHRSDIGSDQISETVNELRRALDPRGSLRGSMSLDAFDGPAESTEGAFDLDLAHMLYTAILAPVADQLPKDHTLLVVPDGPLQFLPLAALVAKAPDETVTGLDRFGRAHWAIRDHAFTTLPVTASLRAMRQTPPRQGNGTFVGIGDPVFSQNRGWVSLDPLPETRDELATLNQIIASGTGTLILGDAAKETAVTNAELRDASVITFATHGLMTGEIEGLAEPALALTPAIAGQTGISGLDDGFLTASEISTLDLDADWVILSACSTASGSDGEGSQGLSGLARAFFYAGARQLVVSHWAVQSDATVALTTGMFEAIADDAPTGAHAIRASMLRMIDTPMNPSWSHPAIWAPFVTVGG
ncbi:MAG: CHAT domain-containing protein [Roseobacter sp.]